MKTFNRTSLPDAIQFNGNKYELCVEASNEFKAHRLTGRDYVAVNVLQRALKGRNDLYGRPYQPSVWIFKKVAEK